MGTDAAEGVTVNADYAEAMAVSLKHVESGDHARVRELHADNYQRRLEAEADVASLRGELSQALALIETLKTSLAEADQMVDSKINEASILLDKGLCLSEDLEATRADNERLAQSIQDGHEMNRQLTMGLHAACGMNIISEGRRDEVERHLSQAMDTITNG